jgi:hypothetical protein
MDQLAFRPDPRLARVLRGVTHLQVRDDDQGALPTLRGNLATPANADVTFVIRVLSSAGIALASTPVSLRRGARFFETPPVALLAMEGYRHLAAQDRQAIERRVWKRRSSAVSSIS